MVPVLALISWKPNQRLPLCIPILVLWPLILVVLFGSWCIGLLAPGFREHTNKIKFAILALAKSRGLFVEVLSDDSFFRLRIV